jgi:DNA ligase-1
MSASWIFKLNESDSRLHKEDVLRQALEASVLGSTNAITFLKCIKICYNPYITFGVRQAPESDGLENRPNNWGEFENLLLKLSKRELTGNAAIDAIKKLAWNFDSVEWNNFVVPVLHRDLRAGISDKTINKVCKGTEYEIPMFGCQLATTSEGRPEMQGVKRLEPKLDGVRVLMVVTPNTIGTAVVSSLSRNGKEFENFSLIEKQISDNFKNLVNTNKRTLKDGFVLDGEIIGASFQELMRQARRKKDANAEDSVFNIFDIIPINEFYNGTYEEPLSKRLKILDKMRPVVDTMPNVEFLTSIKVNLDTAAGKDQLERYAKDMVAQGFEGIMIKDLDAYYVCKRSTSWMKWKPTLTVDLEVVDVQEGTGKNKGRLGALICAGHDEGVDISVNVGSGFTDADRHDYWDNCDSVIGRTAEVLCDSVTKNKDGTYSLRFPRFVRFRDDKSAIMIQEIEEVTDIEETPNE